jgi:hypothetical protein
MLDGKMLRGLTGTPMRMIDFAKRVFAEADPDPLTLANLTTKSLTASSFIGARWARSPCGCDLWPQVYSAVVNLGTS